MARNLTSGEKSGIFWQDEILQVMYWMHGEGFGTLVTLEDLKRFLDAPDEVLSENLARLKEKALVEADDIGRASLTDAGIREGGRRFADEFEGLLKQGHFECNDPDCECHDPESSGDVCKHLSAPHTH